MHLVGHAKQTEPDTLPDADTQPARPAGAPSGIPASNPRPVGDGIRESFDGAADCEECPVDLMIPI